MKFNASKSKCNILFYGSSEYSQLNWLWNKDIYYTWYDFTLIDLDWEYFKFSDKIKDRFYTAPDWKFEFHIAILGFHFTMEVSGYEIS